MASNTRYDKKDKAFSITDQLDMLLVDSPINFCHLVVMQHDPDLQEGDTIPTQSWTGKRLIATSYNIPGSQYIPSLVGTAVMS